MTLEATNEAGKNEAAQQRLVGAFENSGQAIADYEERIKGALTEIDSSMSRDIERHRLDDGARAVALQRIQPATDYAAFHDCDIVIEAATENEELKRQIFRELCPALKPEAIIASNTSSISITRLASITDRPERFIGIHFMNPVPRMQLVELIRGIATEDSTYESSRDFVLKLGKTVTVSQVPEFA